MKAIDLYSGIGGWTLGFRMAGIPVVASYEWWRDANLTHNKNFGSEHAETDIRALDLRTLPARGDIEFVVGSPPCTQFSFSNRGGSGDIKDGLVDIVQFLKVVEHLRPKYWAMENVPRVAAILTAALGSKGRLARFRSLFGDIKVYNSSDFGVPQDRRRMIAGDLPFGLLDEYARHIPKMDLRAVLSALSQAPYVDPIYGLRLDDGELTDHVREPRLSAEEERLNREAKTHHPVYNKMSFPDRVDRPSRTITALCTRVSRESIVIRDEQGELRRLTVRERASIQSFPINYQLFGSTYPNKLKLIGNAVPPLLTFYIAQSMLETPVSGLLRPEFVPRERLLFGRERATDHTPDNEGAKYPQSRGFWLAIRGLRMGSGVRFDLKNFHDKATRTTTWRVGFYYGNSKEIKQKDLDVALFMRAMRTTGLVEENGDLEELMNELFTFIRGVDEQGLQHSWTHADREAMGPITLIDTLAGYVLRLRERLEGDRAVIEQYIKEEFGIGTGEGGAKGKARRNKLAAHAVEIFAGIVIGASFNAILRGEKIRIKKGKVRA